jgi:hypothetical protein
MDQEEKRPSLIEKIKDPKVISGDIYHDVVAGLQDRAQNHESIVQAILNYRPEMFREIHCFADAVGV